MMRVKVYITIDIDPEEYPIPADGDVGMEIEDGICEYFYDVDGALRFHDTLVGKMMNNVVRHGVKPSSDTLIIWKNTLGRIITTPYLKNYVQNLKRLYLIKTSCQA
jgi:hypothetical protein